MLSPAIEPELSITKIISRGGASPTRITIWDIKTGRIVNDSQPAQGQVELQVAGWSPALAEFITVNGQGGLSVWNLNDPTGESVSRFGVHHGPMEAVAWHRSGKRIATTGKDGSILVWDRVSGERLLTLQPKMGKIFELSWDPSGRRLVAIGENGKVKMFDATSGLLGSERGR